MDDLLQDFLSEVLALVSQRWLMRDADVMVIQRVNAEGMIWRAVARLSGDSWDLVRHPPEREIKAVTYQGLRVDEIGQAWNAEFVVDL